MVRKSVMERIDLMKRFELRRIELMRKKKIFGEKSGTELKKEKETNLGFFCHSLLLFIVFILLHCNSNILMKLPFYILAQYPPPLKN